jgi:uncharacterized repeat protein (TIGR01451 family)
VSGGTSADLSISKSGPATVGPNQNITYTLTALNVGPDAAASVTVSDPLPGTLTFVSLSPPAGWSCTTPAVGSGGTVSCTIASWPAGANGNFILTAHVPSGTPDGTTYDNIVTISSATTPDPTPENNSGVTSTVVSAAPDLAISKTHSGNALQGQVGFTYAIAVSNVGGGPTTGLVTVADTVPAGMTATAMTGTGWSCALGATPTCTRSDALAAGGAYPPITLTVTVASNAPASVTNTATVSGTGDSNPANDTANDPTTVTPVAPDLAISKTHSGNALQGQVGFTYSLTVSNAGNAPTSGLVTVADTLPADMTATAMTGTGWSCALGATPTCTRSDALAAAGSYPPITLTVTVASTAPSSVTNTATVSGAGDTNPANNTANDPTTVTPINPDLSISKTHSGNAQRGQAGFAYTIAVSNIGALPTSGTVTVTDTVPTGMTATAVSGTGWSCSLGATSTCTRSDALAGGASYPAITLTVSVATNAPSSVTNTATVSGGGDTNPGNNTATDPTTVTGGPTALSFAFTILAGTSKTVDLTVGATGGPFTGATIVSVIPAGVSTATISASGASFFLTFTPAPLFTGTVVVTYTLSSAVATSAPATVTITVAPRRDPSKDPEVIGLLNAQVAAAERFANAQMMNFNQRLESLHEDGYGQDQQGINGGSTDPANSNAYVADAFGNLPGTSAYAERTRPGSASTSAFDRMITKAEPRTDPAGPARARRDFSFWSSGYVNFGNSNNVIPGSGFDFTTSGVSVGADYRFNKFVTAGIGIGYGRDRTTVGLNGTESRAEIYSVSLYESYRPFKGVFIDGILGFGSLQFDSRRFIADSGNFAVGSRSGNEWFGALSAGYEYRAQGLLLSPYGRIKTVKLTLDPFTETGDPTGSLKFSQQNAETIIGVLGLRGKYDMLMSWGVLSPRFRVEYNHAFQTGGLAALNYADWIGGPTYLVPTTASSSDFATLGLGTDVKFPNQMFVNFDYQTMINAFDTRSHMFQLKAGKKF